MQPRVWLSVDRDGGKIPPREKEAEKTGMM